MSDVEVSKGVLLEILELKGNKGYREFYLPIHWKGDDFYKDLYSRLKDYMDIIGKKLSDASYKKTREDIKSVCQGVCLAVSESLQGNPRKAYDAVKKVLDMLTEKYSCYITDLSDYRLYRATDVGNKAKCSRKRIFHVPFNLRSKMATYRYSIPGYAALYLGNSLELCCAEIGKKPDSETVVASEFGFKEQVLFKFENFSRVPRLIDLSVKPQDFKNETDNNGTKTDKNGRKLPQPLNYLLWYPLIAACSYIRINRADPFAAEYIVPQLVMQWVKEVENKKLLDGDKVLGGVCYFSCRSVKASEMGLNFAFPSTGSDVWLYPDLKNYCPVLAANFKLTEPVFISEYESPTKCEEALREKEMKSIGEFTRDEDIKGEYKIPDGEYYIPEDAFFGCTGLTSIDIPDSVTSIGDSAFSGCTGLTSITIPASVTSIGDYAFSRCRNLISITIPDSVMSIGDCTFSNCTGLTSITIPASVTSIGIGITVHCSNLRKLKVEQGNSGYYSKGDCIIEKATGCLICSCKNSKIPVSVTSIGDWAFCGCESLTSITIPESVTSIGDCAFFGCTGLTSIDIPPGVTSIGDQAFYGCTGLTSIYIPPSVTSIGYQAFYYCTNLRLRVPKTFEKEASNIFKDCNSITYH